MEIERVNDSTIKFFITYKDIEARGFERDEIWYNRERGEELFYDMMREATHHDEFELDGPLWIQVQALDQGLEIIVTRGQVSNGNVKLEIPLNEDLLEEKRQSDDIEEAQSLPLEDVDTLEIVIGFVDIEDVISLSHTVSANEVMNELYHYDDRYYLYVYFSNEVMNEEEQDNLLSRMLEYGYESVLTIHRLQEYGKKIIPSEALAKVRRTFFSNE
ncbi:adaptor protein MecA [Shouchella lonarensis]|uniref:Adapter protein MecA n=1 Tax=Shouchella lonarensis TaxID=1464122 RepID=A0A1G6GNI3_9BACI|nr:adaptor protein MecA [Shouchella lonarensis]SDB82766.1 adapter protein MecA 1/2 [Shouchella lonarensis]